ncbi:GNAT family N-acetyltransferase [Sphingosinicella sp.]|uniref:GNAT family N-acetyltransferase n=1 Tax=Sphingosinicella sp. TaxID=1917971 RepID=UPI0040379635
MFARTPRLLLRPGWREDAPQLVAAIADERIVCNLAQAPWPYRLSDAETFLSRERRPHEPSCLIFRRTEGAPQLIGGIGVGRLPDGDELEFGYWLARPYWGQGYATEAGCALIANARHTLRLKRLVAGHFTDNPASGRVLAKLGFKPTGVTRLRWSAGRRAEAPCRDFVLDLDRQEESCSEPCPMAA